MKKTKLIAGILLMVLGLGVSIGSVVLRYYEHSRNGMNSGHKIINGRGMMGGQGFNGYCQRDYNLKPNPNQSPNPNNNQNQNQGQSGNGGVNQ